MIAVDTSIFVCYLQNEKGDDIEQLRAHLAAGSAWFPSAVVTELLSAPRLKAVEVELILSLPMLEVEEGYWQRAGKNRAKLLAKKCKAKIADALIAQSCIDHDIPLLTRDEDFRYFADLCGLKLVE